MKVSVRDLLEYSDNDHPLHLKMISGEDGLDNQITTNFINRPGLNLFGYYENFGHDRVQIIGRGEASFISKLIESKELENINRFFQSKIPCVIFSHDFQIPKELFDFSKENKIPILTSSLNTAALIHNIEYFFAFETAPRTTIHGVMIEVFGIGILITGESGVGKSECALELIERGHRLISDDVVDIRLLPDNSLIAYGSKLIKHHMEIRGLGILNIAHLFGVGSVRESKIINMIIHLEHWDQSKQYDRLGLEDNYEEILNEKIVKLIIPVQPGRNVPIILETAAMNFRLKNMGYHPAREFNKRIASLIEKGSDMA